MKLAYLGSTGREFEGISRRLAGFHALEEVIPSRIDALGIFLPLLVHALDHITVDTSGQSSRSLVSSVVLRIWISHSKENLRARSTKKVFGNHFLVVTTFVLLLWESARNRGTSGHQRAAPSGGEPIRSVPS